MGRCLTTPTASTGNGPSLPVDRQNDLEAYLLQLDGRDDAGRPSARVQIFSDDFE